MAPTSPMTTGGELAAQLLKAIREAEHALLPGARALPTLWGVIPNGGFTLPQENVLVQAVNILAQSARVFVYGDTIALETQRLAAGNHYLVPLRSASLIQVGAKDLLGNVFICQQGEKQFPPPKWFVDVLLRSELLFGNLPHIRHYARQPFFDNDFVLRGPGWHGDVGILVHGQEIEPALHAPGKPGAPALKRLPPHLRTLLHEFCFRSDADAANTLAMMMTNLLMNHFITVQRPIWILDGSQPALGKTLLARVMGILFDAEEPRLTSYSQNDEELQKRICATLRGRYQSILILDNAKTTNGLPINSPTIEACSMAPEISLRILAKSANFNRPNDFVWSLTMNQTRASPDLVSRCVPTQLAYEGKPEDRVFKGPEPLTYALEHRPEILGELAGLVVRWNQKGRPLSQRAHRCHVWAGIVGGILETAGLPEVLANVYETAVAFNTALDELAALAEAVVRADGPYLECNP